MVDPTTENGGNVDTDKNEIIADLDEETQKKMEVIQTLLEPCDRKTYGKRLREAAEKLGKSKRTVQRLVKKWEEEGLTGLTATKRSDKGNHRINNELQQFIIKTYQDGNKEVFLARAYAQNLETETIALDEAKASVRKVREVGKNVSNISILEEIRERSLFTPPDKKTGKERQKEEQTELFKQKELSNTHSVEEN